MDLARDWPLIAQQPTHNPKSSVTSDNLAYIIYTSGSTGQPKGVMVCQLGQSIVIVNIYGLTEITDINAFAVIRAADLGSPSRSGTRYKTIGST